MAEGGSSSASLHYGLFLHLHHLIRAARAFAAFSKNGDALDLVILRRSRGVAVRSTLPPSRTTLLSLPVELLALIRAALLQSHLDDTPNAFLEKHRDFFADSDKELGIFQQVGCPCCEPEEWESSSKVFEMRRDAAKWDDETWEEHDEDDCDYCNHIEFADSELIRRLLRSRGLALTLSTFLDIENTSTRDVSVPVTLPTNLSPSPTSSLASVAVHINTSIASLLSSPSHSAHSNLVPRWADVGEQTLQTATIYTPSFFTAAPFDDQKFVRLVAELGLSVARIAGEDGGGAPTVSRPGAVIDDWEEHESRRDERKKEKEDTMGEEKKKGGRSSRAEPVQPTFMLLHMEVGSW